MEFGGTLDLVRLLEGPCVPPLYSLYTDGTPHRSPYTAYERTNYDTCRPARTAQKPESHTYDLNTYSTHIPNDSQRDIFLLHKRAEQAMRPRRAAAKNIMRTGARHATHRTRALPLPVSHCRLHRGDVRGAAPPLRLFKLQHCLDCVVLVLRLIRVRVQVPLLQISTACL